MLGNNTDKTRRDVLKATGGAAGLAGLTGVSAAAGREKVEVNVGYSAKSGQRAAASAADSVNREFGFDAMTIEVAKPAVKGLRKRGDVRYVERNGTMYALDPGTNAPPGGCTPWPSCRDSDGGDGGDTSQTLPYGIDRVDAEVAHANGDTGSSADIAILDTGIDPDHPDLQANVGSGKAFASCSSCSDAWADDEGHGTHCAGTADAVDNSQGVVGVSTDATLHSVKVLDSTGGGTYSDIAAGIEYVANQGWDVASMSLGGSSGSQTLKDAVSFAESEGVFLVASAGNSGPCSDCVGFPAAYSEVVAVGATDSSDTLASFSSTGSEVEIAAPGVDVVSTSLGGGTETLSGTSMSCPHVAGAAGLLMANGASASDVRSTLTSTAEDIGYASNETGAGLLDAAAALGLDSSNN
jgi:subtilisin